MKISRIAEVLGATVAAGQDLLDTEVRNACGSDMMSDVLAYVKDQGVLLTGLVNPQVVRTAEMTDIHCIVFVRGKQPDENLLRLAGERSIAVLCTRLDMYRACGRLYAEGLGKREAGER
ncbi:MAG: DRTGG domain-containing protein [Clostridiaceae bacterium]|nr:DRTGG domain-containing protein [Clostridiaceae bacterium]